MAFISFKAFQIPSLSFVSVTIVATFEWKDSHCPLRRQSLHGLTFLGHFAVPKGNDIFASIPTRLAKYVNVADFEPSLGTTSTLC